jgi:hypothetical protein
MTDQIKDVIDTSVFFTELYKDDDVVDSIIDDTNSCLISQEPLTEHHQVLTCEHKFNYIPLYTYIYHYKYTYGRYGPKFSLYGFNCPYCRTPQRDNLPYLPIDGVDEVLGVNTESIYKKRDASCYCMYTSSRSKPCNKTLLRRINTNMFYCMFHFKKIQTKEALENTATENDDTPTCSYVFVKGKCKGEYCKAITSDNIFCKKHLPKVP